MMLPKYIQRIFRLYGCLVSAGHCTPLKWNWKTQSLCMAKKPYINKPEIGRGLIQEFLKRPLHVSLHRICVPILILQECVTLNFNSALSKALNWLAILVLLVYSIHINACFDKSEEIIAYTKGLHQFSARMNQYWSSKKRGIIQKANLLIAITTIPVALSFPPGYVFGLHWFNPHGRTSLIGYWLLEEDDGFRAFAIKLALFLLNLWVWAAGLSVTAFCVGGIQALCTISLRDSIHLFCNMEKSDGMLSWYQKATVYRQVQLLGGLHNDVQSGAIMGVIIAAPLFIIPMGTMITIRFPWTSENLLLLVISGYLTWAATVSGLFIIGGQAGVWKDSNMLVEMVDKLSIKNLISGSSSRQERKWRKIFWRSCRNLIKVKFGSSNFVEEKTPLNCLNCAISLTVQLLLLVR